jgi:hypothetical protein
MKLDQKTLRIAIRAIMLVIILWQFGDFFYPIITNHLVLRNITKQIPQKAFLREYKKLEDVKKNCYIGLYVINYKEPTTPIIPPRNSDESNPPTNYFLDCISATNGQTLSGDYYAFIYKNGKITSSVKLPKPAELDTIPLFLCLYNTPSNINDQYDYEGKNTNNKEVLSNNTLKKVDLIQLMDLTGDGKKNEFLLSINYSGCGFRDHLVVGYNEKKDKVMVYPVAENGYIQYWCERFVPKKGFASVVYGCGDHGNDTYIRNDYRFNPQKDLYENVYSEKKVCQ